MSDKKRRNVEGLPQGRRPYRVESRPTGRRRGCASCGGPVVVKAPSGAWLPYCASCGRVVDTRGGGPVE